MRKPCMIAANWKMNFTADEARQFISHYQSDFSSLCHDMISLVLFPSFEALRDAKKSFPDNRIKIGAQDCSAFPKGSFTGQVSAESLREIGCSHVIIGHSERRTYAHENNSEIRKKIEQALQHNLTPILCIGENIQEYENGITKTILETQLEILKSIDQRMYASNGIIIAYEPVWSIGTGNIPSLDHLNHVFSWITSFVKPAMPFFRFLYGGSVNEHTIKILHTLDSLDGFLIGKASMDFQVLKKIVDCITLIYKQ